MSPSDSRYPLGPLDLTFAITPALRASAINDIAALPERFRVAVVGLTDPQLDTPYREGGWTVRQLVHHVVDSHMNGYIRLKLGLTESQPTIKPYDQARWTVLWRALDPVTFERAFLHPELGPLTLDRHLQIYAWHSRHHTAHATALRAAKGWNLARE